MPISLNNGTATVKLARVLFDYDRGIVRCIYTVQVDNLRGRGGEQEIRVKMADFKAAAPAQGVNGRQAFRAIDRILCEAIVQDGGVQGGTVGEAD